MKAIFTFMLLVLCQFAIAQTKPQSEQPKFVNLKDIVVEKGGDRLVVPIEFQVANNKDTAERLTLIIDTGKRKCFSLKDTVKIIRNVNKTVTFYMTFEDKFVLKNDTTFNLCFTLKKMGEVRLQKTITLKVKPFPNLIYTLWDYSHDSFVKLQNVTKVESNHNILTIYGYHKENNLLIAKRQVMLEQDDVYGIVQPFKWSVSLTTVPFKVRPKYKDYRATAQSGLTNLGLNFSLLGRQWDRYKSDASKIAHKLAAGIWIAPSIEELDAKSLRTSGILADSEKSKQMFASAGLTLNYSYNSLSFVFVPLGFDMPTSKLGKEWIYRGRYWWGFGIAIEPKFFASVLNK